MEIMFSFWVGLP